MDVQDFCFSYDLDNSEKFILALEETIANAILNKPSSKTRSYKIFLRLSKKANWIQALLMDNGDPFNPLFQAPYDTLSPLRLRPQGGIGIHLAKSFVDNIRYKRLNIWNCLCLIARL